MNSSGSTKVKWHDVQSVGMPPAELRYRAAALNQQARQFLVKNTYQLECATLFSDGSGFDTSEYFEGPVLAWAMIDGF